MRHLLPLLNTKRPSEKNFWWLWFLLLGLIMIGYSMSGCITKEKCNERFPSQITKETIIKDSIVHDTLIVTFPSDSIVIHDTISLKCPDFKRKVTNGHTSATISIKQGKLTIVCKEDSLQKVIDQQQHYILNSSIETQKPETIEIHTPYWYDTMCRWVAGLLIIFLLGTLVGKFLKLSSKV